MLTGLDKSSIGNSSKLLQIFDIAILLRSFNLVNEMNKEHLSIISLERLEFDWTENFPDIPC